LSAATRAGCAVAACSANNAIPIIVSPESDVLE